jgi:aerobic carbon-monoxide dehydrogenase large subunit
VSQQQAPVSPSAVVSITEQVREEKVSLLSGLPLRRKEDPRLVSGSSHYVDDIKLPRMLYSSVLRSPYAHARITKVEVSRARADPQVVLVFSARSLPSRIKNSLSSGKTRDGVEIVRPILAEDETTYLGEPVAFVVARTRTAAEDALELIEVSYEPLPAIIDPVEALREDSPKTRIALKSNLGASEKRIVGDVDSAFSKASVISKVELLNQRLAPSPLEPRASLASYDSGSGVLNLWISTQGPFQVKSDISDILNIPENQIRVIAPEVGGGFGAKITLYSEEVLVCLASIELSSPVKWFENRSENLLTMTHGRGQNQYAEIAADQSGRILGLKVRIIGDAGSCLTEGSTDATFTLRMAPGCYVIPAYMGETLVALTNKVPHDAYRGASRPEATYLIERAMDQLARDLGMDPTEVRFRNFIPPQNFPYRSIGEFDYDSGDYSMNLKKALDLADYDRWREEQRRARGQGRLLGIGLCTYVEICAFGPEFPQTAAISVTRSGSLTVISGNSPHGQGHETPLAQIVADELGIPLNSVRVSYGDTAQLPWGTFTAGSRSAAIGGSAVLMCAQKIKAKMSRIAAKNLGLNEMSEFRFANGEIISKEDARKKTDFKEVAKLSYSPGDLPEGMEPVLYAFSAYAPKNYTFPFGTHVAVVEIDPLTGMTKLLDYTSVDDCARVLNPLIVEGQIHGGITQGLGQALLEEIKYDKEGQLLTASFLDYQIPLATDVPIYKSYRTETPTDSNLLGVKGIGEAGTIGATPAIANAVADALAPMGIDVKDMPLSPNYIAALMRTHKKSS